MVQFSLKSAGHTGVTEPFTLGFFQSGGRKALFQETKPEAEKPLEAPELTITSGTFCWSVKVPR